MTPKVSIVIPVYNVATYLGECLDSIIAQTLEDIEIIVVNDGSTDDSLAIAQSYAAKDQRITIIDKPNSGYGHTMNQGFAKAQGEYIGIVESDDCARPTMFEELYQQASQHNADLVRSNYFTMADHGKTFNLIDVLGLANAPYNTPFDPKDYPDILRGSPAIWTGLYKAQFIRENNITFVESPGASYQDTGFFLKVLVAARRVVLMREAFLNYRIDNEGSSVKSQSKVFCVSDEYASFEAFLDKLPERKEAFRFIVPVKKYESYVWNYNRLDQTLRQEFLALMTKEFTAHNDNGDLKQDMFAPVEWEELQRIIFDPASLAGENLTVVYPILSELEHQRTLKANGVISASQFTKWRIKHAFKK